MTTEDSSSNGAKREKLTGFANWPIWSMITKTMLIEKDVWDLIETGPRLLRENPTLFGKKVKEDQMAIGIARRIIVEGISSQIAFNIMDLEDPKDMWTKLKNICSEVGHGVVYSILQEVLNYPRVNKPKGYDKPVMQIFAKVCYLCKRLRTAMTPNRDLWDTIAIVVALDTLHDDFDTTTASLLETGDKTIDEIHSILQSKEAKNISKRTTGGTGDLAMAFRDNTNSFKRKANSHEECFNCHELGHFGRDCSHPDKMFQRPNPNPYPSNNNNSTQPRYRDGANRPNSSRNDSRPRPRAHQTIENKEDDSDPEPFTPGRLGTAFMIKELQKPINATWFLDSCASRDPCNDRRLFSNTRAKSIDFMTAAGQLIRSEEIGTVSIPLNGVTSIELHNVSLAPDCDSNLISLGQLRESGITYHDSPTAMTLMKEGKVIAQAKRNQNLFTLDRASLGQTMSAKAMAVKGRGRPTHLVSQNKRIRIWQQRLAHVSNARVVKASKLVDGIDLGPADREYDPAEVLIDSDNSETSDSEAIDPPRTAQAVESVVSPRAAAR